MTERCFTSLFCYIGIVNKREVLLRIQKIHVHCVDVWQCDDEFNKIDASDERHEVIFTTEYPDLEELVRITINDESRYPNCGESRNNICLSVYEARGATIVASRDGELADFFDVDTATGMCGSLYDVYFDKAGNRVEVEVL